MEQTPNTTNTPADTNPMDNMGYPTEVVQAPAEELPKNPSKDTQSIINEAVKEVTVDDKTGKYVYPEDMDPMLKAAVAATKSYRDNQSGFTKSQQSLKETEAERDALREQLESQTQPLELSQEDKTDLAELLQKDPNAWRVKMNSLEAEQGNKVQELTEEARRKASGEYELEQRYTHLEEINATREHPITPDTLDKDVPPRLTQKLADGKVSFEEYMVEVIEYIDSGTAVSQHKAPETTDLSKANGSSAPSEADKQKQGEIDYSSQTF